MGRRLSLRMAAYRVTTRLAYRRAARHRARLDGVTFVGVTGSCGKTTTKELVAAVLACRGRVTRSPGSSNTGHWVARTVHEARAGDAFAVHEIGASGPGTLDATIALVRPSMAIVTNIGGDHRSAFKTLEATTAEKRKLVEAVPADGVAVLNADDARVMSMASACRGRVITFGLGEGADVRGDAVRSAWPEHLTLAVRAGGAAVEVRTRLNGAHFAHAVLAALAAGLAVGIPLEEGAAAVAKVEPYMGRLNETVVNGVTFLRDEIKAPIWTMAPALAVLAAARAPRRIAVIGTLSDYPGRTRSAYASVARQALDSAEEVLFVGPNAERASGARAHPRGESLHLFLSLRDAADHLARTLRPGDLVLLKGSQRADHLQRLVLLQQAPGSVACWRVGCGRMKFCDGCVLRRVPELPSLGLSAALERLRAAEPRDA